MSDIASADPPFVPAELSELIERAQRNAYYEIGLDLRTIRDSGLYKVERPEPIAGRYSFQTFEEYCEQRWDFDDRRARALIEAATAAETLQNRNNFAGFLPARESHVRPLLALESDEQRAAVWQSVVQERDGQPIRAHDVEAGMSWIAGDWWVSKSYRECSFQPALSPQDASVEGGPLPTYQPMPADAKY